MAQVVNVNFNVSPSQVTQLTGKGNYVAWRLQIIALLTILELDGLVIDDSQGFGQSRARATFILLSTVSDSVIKDLLKPGEMRIGSPHEIWIKIQEKYSN